MNRIDLHIHSSASDGRLSPAALVDAAIVGGLDVIALTDHDTAAGVAEAVDAAAGRPLRIIPGIEISARHGAAEVHLLGYFIDPAADSILTHQRESVGRREDRMRRMVGRMRELGVAVEYADVLRAAGPETRSIGRPHLARALLAAGHVRSFPEAFDRYLADGAAAHVETDFPSVATAIDTIRRAGGVAVWAHPDISLFEREIRAFAALGMTGVECFRPNNLPIDSLLLETTARSLGLFRTGGSDWHGPHRTLLGDFHLGFDELRDFLEAGFAP